MRHGRVWAGCGSWTRNRSTSTGSASRTPNSGWSRCAARFDPAPSLVVRDGVVVELDGKAVDEFDVIDEFIARYGIDLAVAEEAMALDDETLARMAVDFNVPRAEVVRLIGGTTPAKLARVVALLSPVEMQMAMARMRARRTPSNQAHVTNQLDDPLLIAADAASAVAYGFREVETHGAGARRRAVERRRAADRQPGRHPGRHGAVLDRGGAGAAARPARADQLRRDHLDLRHRAGVRRRRRHPVQQGDPHLRLRLPRAEDAGDQRRRRRGADGCRREVLDPVPGVALRLAGHGRWDPRACRTAASTASAWWPRCPTA